MRAGALAFGVLVLAYSGAQVAARHASAGGALRVRLLSALEDRLGPVELGPEVGVDALFRVRCGPLAIPGPRRGDPPLVQVDSIRIRPDLLALLRTGRAAPASVRLNGVHVELPDRPGALREALDRLEGRRPLRPPAGSAAPSDGPTVRVRDLTVAFTADGRRLTAGPIQATVARRRSAGGQATTTAQLRLPGAARGTLALVRDGRGWSATANLERLDAQLLPPELGGLRQAWAGGTLSASLSGDASATLDRARARLEVSGTGLRAGGPVVSAEPLGPVDVRFAGVLAWTARDRQLRLAGGRLELPGGAVVAIDAGAELVRDLPFQLEARAEGVDYLRAVSALPRALSLPEGAPRPAGTLDARARLSGPALRPGAWQVEAALDLSRMREAARHAPPVDLLRPFVQRAEVEDGPPHAFRVGPDNPDFVPVAELPRHVIRAVTASEDAGFYAHAGFDFEELRNAALEGAQAGHVVRGGSTISQQLAKNLYLSREKTLVRKLREAITTVALEATVPKHRLMEIYLNVAEWGPGLWGIGPAARHWFGKDARSLTPREAAFLATVIPNPVRYHYMWNRGWLSEAWQTRVDELLRTMYGQGNLTDEELAEALQEQIVFANPAAGAGGGEPEPADTPDPTARAGAGRRARTLRR